MEIAALSKSWTSDVPAYLLTRFFSLSMAAIFALLMAVCCYVSFPVGVMNLLMNAAIAVPLMFQFRLWDDLSDVEIDRIQHPSRVLVRARSLAPFWCLTCAVGFLNLALLLWLRSVQAVFALMALNLVLLVWYRMPQRSQGKLLNSHVVLLKYPAFIFMLVDPVATSWNLLSAMVCTYLALCVYEVWHDSQLRAIPQARLIAAAEAVIMLAILALSVRSQLQSQNSVERSSVFDQRLVVILEENFQ